MHHLFLGLPVEQLGLAPYVPAESAALDLPARELGFELAPGANVHLLPNIAGFVGADHVAMLLGSGHAWNRQGIVLGMDIGTNTEISLIANGKHYCLLDRLRPGLRRRPYPPRHARGAGRHRKSAHP